MSTFAAMYRNHMFLVVDTCVKIAFWAMFLAEFLQLHPKLQVLVCSVGSVTVAAKDSTLHCGMSWFTFPKRWKKVTPCWDLGFPILSSPQARCRQKSLVVIPPWYDLLGVSSCPICASFPSGAKLADTSLADLSENLYEHIGFLQSLELVCFGYLLS